MLQNKCSKLSMVTPKLNADWLNPDNEKRPMTDCSRRLNRHGSCFTTFSHKKIFYTNSLFLLCLEVKIIPGFSRTMTQIQGLSRAWNFFPPIPGLSRIFEDHGNPDLIANVLSLIHRRNVNISACSILSSSHAACARK